MDCCDLKAETMKNWITRYCRLSFGKLSSVFGGISGGASKPRKKTLVGTCLDYV